jgi:hypothetical protein
VTRNGAGLNSPAIAAPAGNPGTTLPLIIWLLAQLAALSLAAGRVPLWARFPQPGELLAIQFLLAAQVAAASMCFPFLLRDLRAAACILATGWPMALIAGGLAAEPLSRVCTTEGYVSLFLIALTIWKISLRGSMWESCGAAVASLWAVGGAVLVYLRAEFAPGSPGLSDALEGPLVTVVRAAGQTSFFARGLLLQIGVLAALGISFCILGRIVAARRISRSTLGDV